MIKFSRSPLPGPFEKRPIRLRLERLKDAPDAIGCNTNNAAAASIVAVSSWAGFYVMAQLHDHAEE